jgi:hypothetical protein
MTASARSLFVFGLYLLGLGPLLMAIPDLLLAPFGFPAARDAWVRVVGLLALLIGGYYLVAARHRPQPLVRASVPARIAVFVFFAVLVLTHQAPAALLLFGCVDLAAALWTAHALSREAQPCTPRLSAGASSR